MVDPIEAATVEDEALEDIKQWLDIDAENYYPRYCLGNIYELRGEDGRALLEYCKAALRLSQSVLESRTDRFRRVNRTRNDFVIRQSLRVSLTTGRPDVALALLEVANTGSMSLRAIHDSAEQQLDEAALSQLNAQTSDLSRTATRAVADRNDDAILECQAQADWLVAEREFLSDQGETATAGIEDVEALSARIRSAVPEDAALVQFAQVADDIWLVVATCEGISAQRSALTSFDLAMLTTAFRYECDGIYPTDALSALEEGLLTPIEAVLRDKSTVIFAPNVELYGIPFQAMTLGGEHLVETHMISYVASSRDLREGMQQPSKFPLTPSSSCLVLGVPTVSYSDVDELPGVNAEIESIRAFFDAPVVCVEPPAESGDLLKNSASPRVLHLACHGQPETDAILLSRFLMADRPVFAFELMMADLNMDVAVITACETAEASHQAGGHMQSLATAFLRAGVRTVIAAFWPVDDEASAEFMRVFYQELLQGNAAVVALRTAQRHLRAQSRFAHPYFWAPFAIFGVSQPGRSM